MQGAVARCSGNPSFSTLRRGLGTNGSRPPIGVSRFSVIEAYGSCCQPATTQVSATTTSSRKYKLIIFQEGFGIWKVSSLVVVCTRMLRSVVLWCSDSWCLCGHVCVCVCVVFVKWCALCFLHISSMFVSLCSAIVAVVGGGGGRCF